ncbi:MAG: AAA family ATPase [Bacteroidaceae bacterium]|nr:AAA family ATPase [Bacteroidaceae bacterium]
MKKLSQKSSAAMQTLERAIASAEKYKDPQHCLPKTYDWLMEMRQHVETSSYVAQGEYETPTGIKKASIALPGLKSMFSHIADILDDTRNRHSITVADPLNPQGLILQILDRITNVGVERAMKLYAVIEGKRLPVECYLVVAFRVDIIGAGKNAVAPYEKRDGNTWWSEQDLETTVVQMLHMDREDAVKFLDSQVEQKVIERVSGGFAPHAVMKGLRKMSDLRHSDVTPIAINFEDDSPLTQEQRKAINDCLSSGLSILIAPGGSGKTFSLSYAIKELISLGYSVAVVAPTGVACETVRADVRKNIEYKIALAYPQFSAFTFPLSPF